MINIDNEVRLNLDKRFFITYNKAPYYGLLELFNSVIKNTSGGIVVCLIPTVDNFYRNSDLSECLKSDRFRLYEVSYATRVVLESRAMVYFNRNQSESVIIGPTGWLKYKEEKIPIEKTHDFF